MVSNSASNLIAVVVLLSFSTICVETTPQIFASVYNYCEFILNDKKLTFSNKIWTLKTKEFIIYYSLCKSETMQDKCLKNTSSCLLYRKSGELIYFGNQFIPGDDFVLRSSSSERCSSNPTKNYTLSVFLECSNSITVNPRRRYSDDEDECAFEVTMMDPNCQPRCTDIVQNSYLIDIRKFPRNIQIISDARKFSLSLCGGNNNCGENISACEILDDGSIIPLATIESQHLNYDISKNELSSRGKYREPNTTIVRDVKIFIRCNWETVVSNATYKKVPEQGRHYKFELKSSYGCVKIPRRCAFTNNINNVNYNLEKLYTKEGWIVTGVPVGKILVNICGHLATVESVCAEQSSQVCYIDNKDYVNRGSILTSLKEYNDNVTVVFESGSTCKENSSLSYSTEIHLQCSKIEKGPVFEKYDHCVTYLVWETPQACPVDYYESSNCYMNDRISNRDLRKLHTQTDRVYSLSSNNKTKLIYNLCGPIHVTCNNFTNVSFCVKTEQKETVIGWETKDLISDKGNLRMELSGDMCSTNRRGRVIVNFICTYDNPSLNTQINVIEDNCKYNVTIFTTSACTASNIFKDCIYNSHNSTYDLSNLVLKKENYIIESDENIEYIFNLCGPVISGPESQCGGNTMICLHNKTEANIKYRYASLGGVGKPHVSNNTLVIEAKMGSYCPGLGHYKSIIQFECSNQKFLPTFLGEENCVYKFQWKTPEACPEEKQCIVNGTKNDLK